MYLPTAQTTDCIHGWSYHRCMSVYVVTESGTNALPLTVNEYANVYFDLNVFCSNLFENKFEIDAQ